MQFILHIVLWLLIAFISFSEGKGIPPREKTDSIPLKKTQKTTEKSARILYGQASYYASKFEGRKTANGEIFRHAKLTAACNSLPLGTWIKVTNLRNGKSVVVKTNDRLHPKTKRLVDLTHTAAQKLGFIKSGLTRVKVEVLKQKP
jgi:rare lipoprotein A